VTNAVKAAIDAGYRHIDGAWLYETEAEIGVGLKEKIAEGVIKREDMFLTGKVRSLSSYIILNATLMGRFGEPT
jgi:diketogulonate reductase-like aldo/keto reductase